MDIEFLKAVVPPVDGWFYGIRMHEPKQKDSRTRHKAFPAQDPAQTHVLLKDNVDHALYFTPFTFDVDYVKNSEGQGTNARKYDEHKLGCKVLWLDVDCGEGKPYATQEEALKVVFAHCNEEMPKPTYIVDTGGGFHVYWILDNIYGLAAWKQIAARFVQWWKNTPLEFDPISTDSARFLRIPGTNNLKQAEPRPCKRLNYAGAILPADLQAKWPEPEAVSTVETLSLGLPVPSAFQRTDENMGGHDVQSKFFTAEIVKKCEIFKRIASDGGATCDENLWKDVLQTVKLTEDADEWAHKLSEGHEDYSREATDAKMRERTLNKAIKCTTYAAHFDDNPCDGCPLNCKGKSPLSMGREEKPVAVTTQFGLTCVPKGVEIDAKGVYFITSAKGEDQPDLRARVAHSWIKDFEATDRWEDDREVGYARITHSTGGKRVRSAMIPMAALHSTKEANVAMGEAGLSVIDGEKMRRIIVAWYNELRGAGVSSTFYQQEGWIEHDDEIIGFSHGPTVFHKDGRVEESYNDSSGAGRLRSFNPKGEISDWAAAANQILSDGRPEMGIILATAFAAPLVRLIRDTGRPATLSFYSESGSGKSTAVKVAAGVWSSPKPSCATDTSVPAVSNIMGDEPSMPFYWDELKADNDRANAVSVMFQLVQGHTRQKANQHGGNRAVEKVDTIVTLCSNAPFAGEVASGEKGDAEGKRMLEFRLDRAPGHIDDGAIEKLSRKYGAVGHHYAEYLATHIDEITDRLLKEREENLKGHFDIADRFYVNVITYIKVGAQLANELGYINLDVDAIIKCMFDAVDETRAVLAETRLETTCAENVKNFVNKTNGISVKKWCKRGGSAILEQDDIVSPPMQTTAAAPSWGYSLNVSTGQVRIAKADFRAWYEKTFSKKLNWKAWSMDARKEGILTDDNNSKMSLSGSASLTFKGSNSVRCFVVQIPDLADNHLKGHTDMKVNRSDDTDESSSTSELP